MSASVDASIVAGRANVATAAIAARLRDSCVATTLYRATVCGGGAARVSGGDTTLLLARGDVPRNGGMTLEPRSRYATRAQAAPHRGAQVMPRSVVRH